jgi:hypothetical protein
VLSLSVPVNYQPESVSLLTTLDAPPSYGSLFPDKMKPNNIAGRLRRGMSVSQSDGRGDDEESSGCTALCSCLTYLGCGLVVLAITVGLPITMITIGNFPVYRPGRL